MKTASHGTVVIYYYNFQVHAYRGISCNVCKSKNAVFATAIQLEKHKNTVCGKKFICTTCKRQYGGLEHLQVISLIGFINSLPSFTCYNDGYTNQNIILIIIYFPK